MFSGGPGRDFLRAHLNTTDQLPKRDEAREQSARDAMLDPLATKCSSRPRQRHEHFTNHMTTKSNGCPRYGRQSAA
jgi:hypothetical protein